MIYSCKILRIDQLKSVEDVEIKKILQEIDIDDFAYAFSTFSDDIKMKFYKNMNRNAIKLSRDRALKLKLTAENVLDSIDKIIKVANRVIN